MSDLKEQVLDKLAKESQRGTKWSDWKRGEQVILTKQSIKTKDVERAVVLALQLSQAEKFKLAEYYHKQAQEYKKLYKEQYEKSGNYVREIQALELRIKKSQAEVLKEIDDEIVLHLNNAEATNEPCCNCMVENEGDCETMEVLKGLKKRLLAKSEAKKKS